MRKNKSMLTKTVFYGLGISLIIGSLVVPLRIKPDVANNTLVCTNAFGDEEIKIAKNSLVDFDLIEHPSVLSPTVVNQDLVDLFSIDKDGKLSVKDKPNLENYLKSHDGKLDFNELGNGVKIIGDKCFSNISNLHTVTISASVKEIGPWAFSGCEWLSEVVFTKDSKLEKINQSAFQNCFDLDKITIPESVTEIGINAFSRCKNLTNITIPESVNYIGENAFKDCEKLTSYNVINNSPVLFEWWVRNHQYENGQTMCQMFDIDFSQFKNSAGKNFNVIGNNAFRGCTNIINITIPESVNCIDDAAFWSCKNLKSVTFQGNSANLTLGGDSFFDVAANVCYYFEDQGSFVSLKPQFENARIDESKCRLNDGDFVFDVSKVLVGLTKSGKQKETLTIPNSVKTIGGSVFEKNEKLIDITIPASVEKIDGNAFINCSKLTMVTFEGNNPNLTLGNSAFPENVEHFYFESEEFFNKLKGAGKLKNAGIDENKCIVTVGKWFVVGENNTLTSLTDKGKQQKDLKIPSFVTKIGDGVFQGSQALTITVADSVTVIGNSAFSDCSKLESIKFGIQSQLQQIGENAFSGCLKLINIILPTNLTTIGAGAFKECTSLTSIVIPGLVSEIGERAFDNCNHLESITFLGKYREFSLGKKVFPQNINQFYFNDENLFNLLRLETGAGIISNKCVLVQKYFEIKDDNSLIAITSDAQKLSELRIPGFVKIIGNGTNVVFDDSAKFQKVIIPTGVYEIKANAFNGCSSLKEVIINSTDITIDSNAFVNMPNAQYYISASVGIEEQLKQNGINESQIHFLNLSAISIDYATIGIIVGAIVFSIIALGLGIIIPMRKQHRINVLNAKITRNRVEKLAAATALSFKKVLEVSAKTNRKIDKLKAQNRLISANVTRSVDRVSHPSRPTNFKALSKSQLSK